MTRNIPGKTAFALIIFIAALQTAFAQNQVVVNNTPGVVADYKTLQGAVDSVADGTLILLQPGPFTYGIVNIKKRVTIIGPGYFLNHNPDPTRQATPSESVVSAINFDTASNGSYVTGVSITGQNGGGTRVAFLNTSNITISRCLVNPGSGGWIFHSFRSNLITVKQCYIKVPSGFGNATILNSREATGTSFLNNVFENDVVYGFQLPYEHFTNYTAQVLFKNNVMHNLSNPGFYPSACTFTNNIVFQSPGYGSVNAAAATNNVANTSFSAPGININNAVYADVFVLNSDPSIVSQDARFKLKGSSPAIGYGQGGVDCGIFGGLPNEKYELSGIAEFVPNIFYLNVPTVGTTTGGLQVHIKVRANQ
ncbi:MAG: right-handed parallel beta-helix repeat-containing protein [Chitinophagaceae bacterium]